mmetsp:Transcript_33828/g.73786  ORF Transcript_33828/g.73786 Transcript_33828/m.73786 type:complete len:98 (+) Transcript_33828:696-989(+)
MKDLNMVENNKIDYTMQDIQQKYTKQIKKNKEDWNEISQKFEPISDLKNKSTKNQENIQKDIENYSNWKASNEKFTQLFNKFLKHFNLKDIKEISSY